MTGQGKCSQTSASGRAVSNTATSRGSEVDIASLKGAVEQCAAQTHKTAVAIRESPDDGGRISETTGLRTTGNILLATQTDITGGSANLGCQPWMPRDGPCIVYHGGRVVKGLLSGNHDGTRLWSVNGSGLALSSMVRMVIQILHHFSHSELGPTQLQSQINVQCQGPAGTSPWHKSADFIVQPSPNTHNCSSAWLLTSARSICGQSFCHDLAGMRWGKDLNASIIY